MIEFAFWTIAIVSALTMLAGLLWLLWLRARNTLKAASHAAAVASEALSKGDPVEVLVEAGTVTLPRDVDAFGGAVRSQELRIEQHERRSVRRARKSRKHESTYARWSKLYS